MEKQKKLLAVCCTLLLAVGVFSLSMPGSALGQATIPTRTPKPQPTEDSGGGGGGGGGNKPAPTNEPAPTSEPTQDTTLATAGPTSVAPTATPFATATATVPPTETPFAVVPPGAETPSVTPTVAIIQIEGEIVAFPENNEPYPQASPCGLPPTYTASEALTVYAGPGLDYPIAGLLGETEVRPIAGRAAFVNWWMVQLDETGRAGWVSDDWGTVHGYIERVPILNAPTLNGAAPTPGSTLWSPTPPAVCDAPELVIGAAVADDASGFNVVPPSGKPDSLKNLYDGLTVDEGASTAAGSETTAIESTSSQESAENLIEDIARSAPPLEISRASSMQQLPNLMPVVGFVLILAAVIVGLFARRGGSSGEPGD